MISVYLFFFLFLCVWLEGVRTLLQSANASIMSFSMPDPTGSCRHQKCLKPIWPSGQVPSFHFLSAISWHRVWWPCSKYDIFWLRSNAWRQACAVAGCWCGTATNNYNQTRQAYFVSNYSLPEGHWTHSSHHGSSKPYVSVKNADQ